MKGEEIEIKVGELEQCLAVLKTARLRGNIPTNYMVDRNIDIVSVALKPFMDAHKEEPMCFLAQGQKSKPSKEQMEDAASALDEWRGTVISVKPYRIQASRLSDNLNSLSPSREFLSAEQLATHREDFVLMLGALDIVTED